MWKFTFLSLNGYNAFLNYSDEPLCNLNSFVLLLQLNTRGFGCMTKKSI